MTFLLGAFKKGRSEHDPPRGSCKGGAHAWPTGALWLRPVEDLASFPQTISQGGPPFPSPGYVPVAGGAPPVSTVSSSLAFVRTLVQTLACPLLNTSLRPVPRSTSCLETQAL